MKSRDFSGLFCWVPCAALGCRILICKIWNKRINMKYSTHTRHHTNCPKTDWLAGWLTGWLKRWLAYFSLTDCMTDWLTDGLHDLQAGWLDRLFDWLAGWLVDWLAGWLADWLTSWLTCATGFLDWIAVHVTTVKECKRYLGTLCATEMKTYHRWRQSEPVNSWNTYKYVAMCFPAVILAWR